MRWDRFHNEYEYEYDNDNDNDNDNGARKDSLVYLFNFFMNR